MKRPKAFLVFIRGCDPKQIDEDEVAKVIGAWHKKTGTTVRQGFINGVDVVDIREDSERIGKYMNEFYVIEKSNKLDREYEGGKRQRSLPQFEPLRNIFEGMDVRKFIEEKGPKTPELSTGKKLTN